MRGQPKTSGRLPTTLEFNDEERAVIKAFLEDARQDASHDHPEFINALLVRLARMIEDDDES